MNAIVYYIFVYPLSRLPLWITYRFADFFYLLLITVLPYRKKVITSNLERCFPEKSKRDIAKLRRKFYRVFTDMLIEGIKNMGISEKELRKRFRIENPELMDQLYAKGKSVLLVSAHYNNWEWMITGQNLFFKHQAVGIGMPLTSGFWDKKINALSENLIALKKELDQAYATLEKLAVQVFSYSDAASLSTKKINPLNCLSCGNLSRNFVSNQQVQRF